MFRVKDRLQSAAKQIEVAALLFIKSQRFNKLRVEVPQRMGMKVCRSSRR